MKWFTLEEEALKLACREGETAAIVQLPYTFAIPSLHKKTLKISWIFSLCMWVCMCVCVRVIWDRDLKMEEGMVEGNGKGEKAYL